MLPDYSRQNLRGRTFKGQNLEGANFSYADIRSTDFSGAKLRDANFSHAKAGLQKRWTTILVLVACLIAGLSGFLSAYTGVLISSIYSSNLSDIVVGWTALIVVIVIFILIIYQGLNLVITFTYAITGAGAVAFAVSGAVPGAFAVAFGGAVAIAGAIAGAVVGTIAGTIAGAIAEVVAGTIARSVAFVFVFFAAIAGAVFFVSTGVSVFAGVVAIAGAFVFALLSICICRRALKGDERYALIHNTANAFAAFKGTSFRNADLTDANFTEAVLKSTDFREAILTRTYWWNARKLDLALPGTTYLRNVLVRQLVVTGDGKNQNFDRLDLRGLNLRDTNLENASFIDTDFYKATLQRANLSRAILVRTQMERADLRGACLTGSCIQDWTISRETKLDRIICNYVYLKWVDGDKRDQMPPRGKFKEGGFVTFVKYILDTVELYHEKDINPRLALTVLQKMARDYDEPLNVVALGKRGEKVFIQVKVSEQIIQDQFKEDYYSRYDEDLKLWSGNIHQLPPAVNSFIEKRIGEIVSERTDDFVFIDVTHVEGNYIPTYQGDITMTGERTINMGSGNYNERIQGNYIQGNQNQQNMKNKTSKVKTILILAANPKTTSPLRLDEEVREIDAGLQRAKKREQFDLEQRWAVRVQDVYQALLDFKPQFVHFSGHGTGDDGLVLEDETGNKQLVDTIALAELFKLFTPHVECVVLNACYSEIQADAIAQHIPYVIGMNKAIGDKAAIKFATGFYNALGAGESVEFAYKLGCNVIQLDGIPENLTPDLKKKQ